MRNLSKGTVTWPHCNCATSCCVIGFLPRARKCCMHWMLRGERPLISGKSARESENGRLITAPPAVLLLLQSDDLIDGPIRLNQLSINGPQDFVSCGPESTGSSALSSRGAVLAVRIPYRPRAERRRYQATKPHSATIKHTAATIPRHQIKGCQSPNIRAQTRRTPLTSSRGARIFTEALLLPSVSVQERKRQRPRILSQRPDVGRGPNAPSPERDADRTPPDVGAPRGPPPRRRSAARRDPVAHTKSQ